MLRFLYCLQTEHDWRLVLLAVAVCFLTSFGGLSTFQRASDNGRPSTAWLLTAGVMTGCGIWATHFIAILAFTPGFEGFNIGLTILSLAFAAAMVTAGFAVAALRDTLSFGIGGGFIVGAAIAVMHYTGVAALDMPAVVGWSIEQFAASIIIGQLFAMAAMVTVGHKQGLSRVIASGALLALAIVSHHFISMSAMTVIADRFDNPASQASRVTLSIAITLVMAVLIVACLLSAVVDRRARRRLAERNMQLDAALNHMSEGLCLFDRDGRLRLSNPRFLAIYGLRLGSAPVGATIADLDDARRLAGTRFQPHDQDATSPEHRDGANQSVKLQDGRTVNIAPCPLPDGGWVVTHSDITRRRQNEARIEHLSQHDPLTGLANRSAFNRRLDLAIREAAGNGGSFALICVDLDQFKQVNDLFGHTVGDDLLQAVAERLRVAAHGAFLARLAGDEFTIISTVGKHPETAAEICARISASFETEFMVRDIAIPSPCSIGVSVFPQDAADAETLRMHADVALRRAKTRESGAVCFFEPVMDEHIRAGRELHRDLAAAIAAEELELYYQPQATNKGDIVSFEVLLRWLDRKRGFVPPDVFIPIAEEMGLIGAIDAWVLRNACREAASWPQPLLIAVNLSAASFTAGDVERLIGAALAESGLAAARLEIEITESVLIADFAGVSAALHRIRALGVRIAIDDFGKGYSSLSYLQSFPFDKLKIDRAFISADDANAISPLIVTAIVGLGHTLKLKVLAEGVETEAQRDFLIESGCDELQGYFLGRPKPIGHYKALTHRDDTSAPRAIAV